MDELLKALTRAALAVAAYYEGQANSPCTLDGRPGKTLRAVTPPTPKAPLDLPESARFTPAAPKTETKAPTSAEPAAPASAKRGRPKKAAPAEPAVATPALAAAPAELPIDPEYAGLTEDESAKRIFEVGEALISKFPTLAAPGPDGEPAPEGFHMLVSVLKESFKVDRVTKLSPRQRLQFMTIVKGKLGTAPAAPAASSTGEDPNLGV